MTVLMRLLYSPTETLVEFDFGCKFNNNNGRIRFYFQVITFVINIGCSFNILVALPMQIFCFC
jgi:hypothetical protein